MEYTRGIDSRFPVNELANKIKERGIKDMKTKKNVYQMEYQVRILSLKKYSGTENMKNSWNEMYQFGKIFKKIFSKFSELIHEYNFAYWKILNKFLWLKFFFKFTNFFGLNFFFQFSGPLCKILSKQKQIHKVKWKKEWFLTLKMLVQVM